MRNSMARDPLIILLRKKLKGMDHIVGVDGGCLDNTVKHLHLTHLLTREDEATASLELASSLKFGSNY